MIVDANNPNLEQLLAAAEKLAPLLDHIVFVGGCVTGLLITDPGASPVRPTLDVDAIVEIATYVDFTLLEEQLRQLGFRESRVEDAPVCRWINQDLILDLMPTDASILGFSNRWYRPAFKNAQSLSMRTCTIQLITAPYFLATKLEAFHGRGRNDFRMSHDLEDIVTVIDGRAEIIKEVSAAEQELRRYLYKQFQSLLANRDFLEALPGHLLPDHASQQRASIVIERIQQFTIES
jgi:predicted nucleotidyltransferase